MLGQASNPMLAKAEQGIQAKVPQNMQDALSRVVHAGLTIMYSDAPNIAQARDQRLRQGGDPVQNAADGAARMMANLYAQSHKSVPMQVLVPAGMIFALEYLDLIAKVGKAKIAPDLLSKTMVAVGDAVMSMLHVTPDKLQTVVAQAKQQGQAPAQPAAPRGIINQQMAAA